MTSLAKREAVKRYKDSNFSLGKCRDCGRLCENQSSPRCNLHRRWQQVRMIANRAFMKDFI